MGAELDHRREVVPSHRPAEPAYEPPTTDESHIAAASPVRGLAAPIRRAADPLGGSRVDGQTAAQLAKPTSGKPLHDGVRRSMESIMGADFRGVRVHDDDNAAGLAHGMAATAFTHGENIYFSRGAYAPDSEHGQRLLAHELAHVSQRQRGADPGTSSGAPEIGHADDPLEHDAERTAGHVVQTLRAQAKRVGTEPTP